MILTEHQTTSLINNLKEKIHLCKKEVEDWERLEMKVLENYTYGRIFAYKDTLDLIKNYLQINGFEGLQHE